MRRHVPDHCGPRAPLLAGTTRLTLPREPPNEFALRHKVAKPRLDCGRLAGNTCLLKAARRPQRCSGSGLSQHHTSERIVGARGAYRTKRNGAHSGIQGACGGASPNGARDQCLHAAARRSAADRSRRRPRGSRGSGPSATPREAIHRDRALLGHDERKDAQTQAPPLRNPSAVAQERGLYAAAFALVGHSVAHKHDLAAWELVGQKGAPQVPPGNGRPRLGVVPRLVDLAPGLALGVISVVLHWRLDPLGTTEITSSAHYVARNRHAGEVLARMFSGVRTNPPRTSRPALVTPLCAGHRTMKRYALGRGQIHRQATITNPGPRREQRREGGVHVGSQHEFAGQRLDAQGEAC